MRLSRRGFAGATALVPLAAMPAARSAARAAPDPSPSPGPWQIGARPDYKLAIAARQVELFGRQVQGLLVNELWPGTTIRYSRGDRFRVLVEILLDQPTSLHWHGLVDPNLEDGVPKTRPSSSIGETR
jgi:FtsP/CotA-like multicopper oxidase with cupredoxin domain